MQAQMLNTSLSETSQSVKQPLSASLPRLDSQDLNEWNQLFEHLSAEARVELALRFFPNTHVLSSSFGAQAAVSLHLLTQAAPDIPVILLDTGYLFKETYAFVEELASRLDLNLQVYRNPVSPAEQEAQFGQRWLQGEAGLDAYNFDNKVEPMERALHELQAGTWFTGLRRSQSGSRAQTPFVQRTGEPKSGLGTGGQVKVSPIADWSDKDVFNYLKKHNLPYHPLWEQGYISIGDTHTTKSVYEVANEEDVRFFGIKRECGLHV